MTDPILYNFGENISSLGDIKSHMESIQSAQDDIHKVFGLLGEVYEGAGADALQAHHKVIQDHFGNHMLEMQGTHKGAGDQQDFMSALDVHNSSQF